MWRSRPRLRLQAGCLRHIEPLDYGPTNEISLHESHRRTRTTPALMVTEDIVREALKTVVDPEIELSITDLGLIYGVDIADQGQSVTVRMTLTSPGCPYGPVLVSDAKRVISALPGVKQADVQVVWDPPWNPRTMVSDEIKDKLGIW